jgi:hypothetical protein
MSICALEIGTSAFVFWVNVPTTASLICDQRSAVCLGDSPCEGCIFKNGLKAVVDGERGALDGAKCFGDAVICLLGKYQV